MAFQTLPEMEISLQEMYAATDDSLRLKQGVTDQSEIDRIMQMLIDRGDMSAPYVIKRDSTGYPVYIHLNYVEYKKYRRLHAIDTTTALTIKIALDSADHEADMKPLISDDSLRLLLSPK